MINKVKVIIIFQLAIFNIFLSVVNCDVNELGLVSTTTIRNDKITDSANIQNFDSLSNQNDNSNSQVAAKISLYDNDVPKNQLPADGPAPRFGLINGIKKLNYNGGLQENVRSRPSGIEPLYYYNRPIVEERPIVDVTGDNLGQNIYNQPSLGAGIYNKPNFQGTLGQNVYSHSSLIEKPIYDYNNGNIGQYVNSRPSCSGGNIDERVYSQPSYQPNNGLNGYVYNKPSYPLHQDDSIEIISGYIYQRPGPYLPPVYPTYIPPTYSTTPETIFPPATARILLPQHN